MQQFTWFLPSMYGDIKLNRVTSEVTKVTLTGLSPTEKMAVKALFQKAVKPGGFQKVWATEATLEGVDLGSLREQGVDLNAPMSKVQDFLQKHLKPHRKQISAVRFTNGKLEELSEATLQVIDSEASPEEAHTVVATSLASPATEPHGAPKKKPESKPKVAVTVAQPVLGCPAPEFDEVDLRANRVLAAFLEPHQVEDFNRYQQFVATGADTGHRYLLSSRSCKRALSQHSSFRSLYDLDEECALCVHDWEVPEGEELLGLLVHISLPGLEQYVRGIPAMGDG
jgi:hypothetical protein